MTQQLTDFETAVLARKKGFNEICRNMWMNGEEGPFPVNAPTDEELIGGFMNMYTKFRDYPDKLLKLLEKRMPKPLRNATLPDMLFSRPTQDLLERWLREEHKIFISVVERSEECIFIVPMTLSWSNSNVWKDTVSHYGTFELAREAALVHALKLIPDA